MKRTTLWMALTLGLAALNAPAQSQGDQSAQLARPPKARVERESNKEVRRPADGPRAERRRDMARQRQRGAPRDWQPGGRGFGDAPPDVGRGEPGFRPPGRGPAWNGPGRHAGRPEVCPHCGRPFGWNTPPGLQRRGRNSFGPGSGYGPGPRGWGNAPQDRGPAFGPPPWAGRGGPDAAVRPGPRAPGRIPPPGAPQFAPGRRGPVGPGGRFDAPPPRPAPEDRDAPVRSPRERD